MLFAVLLLVGGALTVECIDIQTYSSTPEPVQGFDLFKYAGQWYLFATTQPCSWKGASKFTDWTQNHVVQAAGRHEFTDTYRSQGSCVTIRTKVTSELPGVFTYYDTIGDVFSGKVVVVCVDYDEYVITWGCVDTSADGTSCDDGWVTVKTRHPKPSHRVLAKIDAKLKELWGISARDLGFVKHTNPCGSSGMGRLRKTY